VGEQGAGEQDEHRRDHPQPGGQQAGGGVEKIAGEEERAENAEGRRQRVDQPGLPNQHPRRQQQGKAGRVFTEHQPAEINDERGEEGYRGAVRWDARISGGEQARLEILGMFVFQVWDGLKDAPGDSSSDQEAGDAQQGDPAAWVRDGVQGCSGVIHVIYSHHTAPRRCRVGNGDWYLSQGW
jgi:hypothetical protein